MEAARIKVWAVARMVLELDDRAEPIQQPHRHTRLHVLAFGKKRPGRVVPGPQAWEEEG